VETTWSDLNWLYSYSVVLKLHCWQDGRIQMEPEVCEVILRNLGGFAEARSLTTTTYISLDLFLVSHVMCSYKMRHVNVIDTTSKLRLHPKYHIREHNYFAES
jgi:hypothetical protein